MGWWKTLIERIKEDWNDPTMEQSVEMMFAEEARKEIERKQKVEEIFKTHSYSNGSLRICRGKKMFKPMLWFLVEVQEDGSYFELAQSYDYRQLEKLCESKKITFHFE